MFNRTLFYCLLAHIGDGDLSVRKWQSMYDMTSEPKSNTLPRRSRRSQSPGMFAGRSRSPGSRTLPKTPPALIPKNERFSPFPSPQSSPDYQPQARKWVTPESARDPKHGQMTWVKLDDPHDNSVFKWNQPGHNEEEGEYKSPDVKALVRKWSSVQEVDSRSKTQSRARSPAALRTPLSPNKFGKICVEGFPSNKNLLYLIKYACKNTF